MAIEKKDMCVLSLYCANLPVLWDTNFLDGCFEFCLSTIFATAPKIK